MFKRALSGWKLQGSIIQAWSSVRMLCWFELQHFINFFFIQMNFYLKKTSISLLAQFGHTEFPRYTQVLPLASADFFPGEGKIFQGVQKHTIWRKDT